VFTWYSKIINVIFVLFFVYVLDVYVLPNDELIILVCEMNDTD